MSNLYKARMENAKPVILPPTNNSVFQDFSLEPQLIIPRQPNSFNLILDSSDAEIFDNVETPVDLVLAQDGTKGSILSRKVKRMGVTRVAFSHCTPNINARNNQFLIYRADTNAIVSTLLPEAFIRSPLELIDYIITYLNLNAGLAGMNFSRLNASRGPENVFNLLSDVAFVILRESNCMEANNMYGLRPTPEVGRTPAALAAIASRTQTVGPIHLQYSAYVDFASTKLTSYTKAPNASTSSGSNRLLYRFFLPRWLKYESDPYPPATYFPPTIQRDTLVEVEEPVYFTWNPEENLSVFDIQVLDDQGRFWYVPEQFDTSDPAYPIKMAENGKKWTGVQWSITLNCEI